MDLVWVLKIFWEPFFWAYGPLPARARGVEEAVRAAAAARLRITTQWFFSFQFFFIFFDLQRHNPKKQEIGIVEPASRKQNKRKWGLGGTLNSYDRELRSLGITTPV